MSYISVPPGSPTPTLQPLYELEPPPAAAPRRQQWRDAFYRSRGLGLALLVTGLAAAGAYSLLVRPYYVADGSLVIEHPSLHNAELTPQEYPPAVDADRELQTQLTVMASRAVADPVIAGLRLEQRDPEIRTALQGLDRALAKKRETASPGLRAEIAAGVFASKLKLLPDKLSDTVHVQYGSRDPQVAAAVVNATIAGFGRETLAERGAMGATASHWMRVQVEDAQSELARDDSAVAAFQQAHAFIPLTAGADAANGLLTRLADANHAWSTAQAERLADQAALDSYGGAVVAALPAELRDPAIDKASENVSAAQQQLTTLATTYRPDFPLVVEARAQLAGAEQALAGLRQQVTAGLRQRLASSQRREQQLAAMVGTLNQEAAADSGLGLRFGVLKARADGQRALVDQLRQKLNEVELQASLPPSNIHPLDPATPPLLPSYPRLPLDLGLGLGLGLAAAVGVGLARERWSEALSAPEAVKRGLGPALAPLGMIAAQPLGALRPRALPAATGADAGLGYAKIAANLAARCGPPPRIVLITSANPGEGKTTSLCQLGLALAQAGWRTLLVDADTRNPSCHSYFGLGNTHGLLAAQSGRKLIPLAAAPHLDLVPCESGNTQPLQARAMAGLLEQWREHYDYILIDSPSGNLGGEAVLLSSLVEGVLVVLRWNHTRLSEAQQLCEELARARAPLVGTLFQRADPRAPAYRAYRSPAA